MVTFSGFKKLVFPYVGKYGLYYGVKMGIAMRDALWNKPRGNLIPFKIPGIKSIIYIRADTADAGIFDQVFLKGVQLPPLSKAPEFIVDLGANIGLTSVLYANTYPNAKIIALEPEEGNYNCLIKNTKGYKNIECVKKAVWGKNTKLKLVNPDAIESAFYFKETEEKSSVDSINALSIGSLMELYSLPRIDLLKIDVEGTEVELFYENRPDWMNHVQVLLIELHDRLRTGCSKAFYSVLNEDEKPLQHGEYTVVKLNPE